MSSKSLNWSLRVIGTIGFGIPEFKIPKGLSFVSPGPTGKAILLEIKNSKTGELGVFTFSGGGFGLGFGRANADLSGWVPFKTENSVELSEFEGGARLYGLSLALGMGYSYGGINFMGVYVEHGSFWRNLLLGDSIPLKGLIAGTGIDLSEVVGAVVMIGYKKDANDTSYIQISNNGEENSTLQITSISRDAYDKGSDEFSKTDTTEDGSINPTDTDEDDNLYPISLPTDNKDTNADNNIIQAETDAQQSLLMGNSAQDDFYPTSALTDGVDTDTDELVNDDLDIDEDIDDPWNDVTQTEYDAQQSLLDDSISEEDNDSESNDLHTDSEDSEEDDDLYPISLSADDDTDEDDDLYPLGLPIDGEDADEEEDEPAEEDFEVDEVPVVEDDEPPPQSQQGGII